MKLNLLDVYYTSVLVVHNVPTSPVVSCPRVLDPLGDSLLWKMFIARICILFNCVFCVCIIG